MPMPNPMITVAMPFFNSAATLELAIRSLLNQSYGNFELLLCDDGSDDRGLAIAQSFLGATAVSITRPRSPLPRRCRIAPRAAAGEMDCRSDST